MGLSTHARNTHAAAQAAAAVYVELYDGDPGLDGNGANKLTTQLVGSATRPQITWGAVEDLLSGRGVTHATDFEFVAAAQQVADLTVRYVGFWDAADGGNFWGSDSLSSDKIVQQNDPVVFEAGQLIQAIR